MKSQRHTQKKRNNKGVKALAAGVLASAALMMGIGTYDPNLAQGSPQVEEAVMQDYELFQDDLTVEVEEIPQRVPQDSLESRLVLPDTTNLPALEQDFDKEKWEQVGKDIFAKCKLAGNKPIEEFNCYSDTNFEQETYGALIDIYGDAGLKEFKIAYFSFRSEVLQNIPEHCDKIIGKTLSYLTDGIPIKERLALHELDVDFSTAGVYYNKPLESIDVVNESILLQLSSKDYIQLWKQSCLDHNFINSSTLNESSFCVYGLHGFGGDVVEAYGSNVPPVLAMVIDYQKSFVLEKGQTLGGYLKKGQNPSDKDKELEFISASKEYYNPLIHGSEKNFIKIAMKLSNILFPGTYRLE